MILLIIRGTGFTEVTAFAIFGTTMVMMYTASTLYHYFNLSEKGTRALRKVDHIMIYLFIAGSFTPFILIILEGQFKWIMFSVIWGIALGGTFFKLFWLNAPSWLSLMLYLGMGWLGVILTPYIAEALSSQALFWLVGGGVAYTIGAVIYGVRRPNPIPDWFGFHEIWHLFVMAGSFFHFWAVYWYLPAG